MPRRKGVRAAETAVIAAAIRHKRAKLAGDMASVLEEQGEERPERSSDSWYEEASEYERALFAALAELEKANA